MTTQKSKVQHCVSHDYKTIWLRIQYLIISGPLKVCTPGIYGFLVINAHFYISNKGDNSLPAITIMLFCDQGRTTPKKVNILESLTIIVYLLLFHSHILQSPAVPSQSPLSTLLTFSLNPPQSPQLTPTSLSLSCVPTSCSQILDAAHGCACLRCAPSTEVARAPNHCTRPHCTRAHWSWLVLVQKIQIQRQMHIHNDKQDKCT